MNDDNKPRRPGNRPSKPSFNKPNDKPRAGKPAFHKPDDKPRTDRPTSAFHKPDDKPRTDRPTSAFKPMHARPQARPQTTVAPSEPVINRAESDARWAALSALTAVTQDGAYSGLALNQVLRDNRLMDADRRLATELFYGTLENIIRIDYTLSQLLNTEPDLKAKNILRIAVYQLMYLTRIPESAACNEAVKQTRRLGMPQMAGFINGVLRNLLRKREELVYPKREDNVARFMSIEYSMPEFIAERLISEYGEADAEQICAHRTHDNSLCLHPNLLRMSYADMETWLETSGYEWEKGVVSGSYRVRGIGDIERESAYIKGRVSVIGESSLLAAQVVGVQPGWLVLDACAAPGGKSACMAELMQGAGRVYSCDVHQHRVELIRSMAERLHMQEIKPSLRDATKFDPDLGGVMNAVLCDAPCSGLGVIEGKPDIKNRLKPEELESLPALQARILDNCARYVKPGGTLVYSTCTLLDAENAGQVRDFLKRHPEYALDDITPYIPETLREHVHDGMLQLLRHRDGIDGFFIARMKRAR